jgi:hypothetical protein
MNLSLCCQVSFEAISLEPGGMAKTQNPKGSKMADINTAFDPVEAALKQMHQAVSTEEVPADFLRILDDIDAKIAAAKAVR